MPLKWMLAAGDLLVAAIAAAVIVFGAPPAWLTLLLGTIALASLYIVVRFNSRYDPLDPRFGSCIPPPPRWKEPRGDAWTRPARCPRFAVYSLIQIKHYFRKVRTVRDTKTALAGSGRETKFER